MMDPQKEPDTIDNNSNSSTAPKPAEQDSSNKPDDLAEIDLGSDIEEERPSPASFIPPKHRRSKKWLKWLVIIVIALIIIGGVAYGAKKLLNKKPNNTAKPSDSSSQSSDSGEPADNQAEPALKDYKNDDLKIELSYPSDWKITEDTDKVTISSPSISYQTKDGKTTKDVFRLIVQTGINQVDTNAINNTVAVKDSELIKYDDPVKNSQRSETYLSYVGNNAETFNFAIISSGKQYAAGDKVAGTLPLGPDSYIVVAGYGAKEDGIEFDSISLDNIDQSPVFDQAVTIIKSLKIH